MGAYIPWKSTEELTTLSSPAFLAIDFWNSLVMIVNFWILWGFWLLFEGLHIPYAMWSSFKRKAGSCVQSNLLFGACELGRNRKRVTEG